MNNSLGQNKAKSIIKPVVLVIVLAFFVLAPLYGLDYMLSVFTRVFLYMALGQMWNLLAGYAGLASLGQQVFVGLGGYCLAVLTQKLNMSIFLSFVVTVVVTFLVALLMSLPIFKMKGVYFTIGTWIVAEALGVFFTNWAFANYAIGFSVSAAYTIPVNLLYWMALILGVGGTALVYGLLRSRIGLALMSTRDNESAAEVRGVKLFRTKLTCFLIAAVFTGVVGVVLFLVDPYIKPANAFGIDWSVSMVFIVVIGGIGTIEGPIIGAFIYIVLRQWLYNFPGISMIILGAIAVAVILLLPRGIMGTIHHHTGFEVFSIRRKIRPPVREGMTLKDALTKM